jgi:hypothetical protein
MSSDNKDLMNEVAGIMDTAAKDIDKAREAEMKLVLRTIVDRSQEDKLLPTGQQVLLYLIGQTPIEDIDSDKAVRTDDTRGKTVEQLKQEGYTGGNVTRPFTFDTYEDCLGNMDNPISAILADYSQHQRPWASVTCHKEQGTTTYIMVASHCVTIHKVLPTGDSITSYHNPSTSETEQVEGMLYTQGKRIVKSQYRFTTGIQQMRKEYPSVYKVMLDKTLKAMEESDNGDNEQ